MASATAFATSVSGMKSIESVIYKTKKTTSACSTSSFSFQCRAFRKPIGKNSKRRIMKRRVSLTPRCEVVSTEDLVRDDQNISKASSVSALKASGIDKTENTGEEALQMFLKERQLEGDFVSKLFDILWRRDDLISADSEASMLDENPQLADGVIGDENDGGFLKLTKTQEWVLGDETAPINKKAAVKEMLNDRERRKKLDLLRYDALKKEMMMLTVGIGIACSGYCLVAFSVQAAISYAVGVLFSCLYLQLLSQYVDNLSREEVPQIFMKKKLNKIGIRSEDLQNLFERTINGSFVALSSPRLVIPVAIYGLWWLSYHFSSDIFGFELVPAMFGLFAYKAAALVQVYRDNEDLKLVFPEN